MNESQFNLLTESKEYLNFLLDKINDEGYESLNDREKDALIRISKGEDVYDEPEKLPVSDDVYDPNRMFIKYVLGHKQVEVEGLNFQLKPMSGNKTIEVVSEYHNFLLEPKLDENVIYFLDNNTDEVDPIKLKKVPDTTEDMRGMAVKFVFQVLPKYIKKYLN